MGTLPSPFFRRFLGRLDGVSPFTLTSFLFIIMSKGIYREVLCQDLERDIGGTINGGHF
jgi:hypothetical protein